MGLTSNRRVVPLQVLTTSLGHLAFLLRADIQIGPSLDALTRDPEHVQMGRAWEEVRRRVEAGHTLSDCFSRQPEVFPPLVVMLARAGEETGELASRLQRATDLLARQVAHLARVRQALTTPVLTAVFSLIVLFVLVKTIMPRFVEMYASLRLELPLVTRLAIGVVQVLNHPALPALLLILGTLAYLYQTAIRRELLRLSLELPFTRPLVGSLLASEFCDILAGLYGCGVPLNRALTLLEGATEHESYARCLAAVRQQLESGRHLSEAVREELAFFPRSVPSMLEVGVQTGVLDVVLNSVQRLLELEVESRLETLQVALEPILMAGLGAILATFFVAMMLPMYEMIGKLGF